MSDSALPDPTRSARPRTAARPALRASLAILLGLPLLLGLLFWMVRSAPIDPATAETLRRLREPPPPEGENALTALMMLRYELDESRRAEIAAADLASLKQRYEAWMQGDDAAGSQPFRSSAEGHWPASDLEALPALACRGDGDCFDALAGLDRKALARLRGQRDLLERIDTLHAFGHLRYPHWLQLLESAPLDSLLRGRTARIENALAIADFREGRVQPALARVCRQQLTARRFAAHADSLLLRSVEQAILRNAARALTEMLARLPVETPLPSECEGLREPLSAHWVSMCPAMGGEFAFVESSVQRAFRKARQSDPRPWVPRALTQSPEQYERWQARAMAFTCDDSILARMRGDDWTLEAALRELSHEPPLLPCLAAFEHCQLFRIAHPDYRPYLLRSMDDAARIRGIALLLDLRDRMAEGKPAQDMLQALAAVHGLAQRAPSLQDDTVIWSNLDHRTGEFVVLPLPASRVRP